MNNNKIKSYLAYTLVGIFLLTALGIAVYPEKGNPINYLNAKKSSQQYFKQNYPEYSDYYLDTISASKYNFTVDGYHAVFLNSERKKAFTVLCDSLGNVINDDVNKKYLTAQTMYDFEIEKFQTYIKNLAEEEYGFVNGEKKISDSTVKVNISCTAFEEYSKNLPPEFEDLNPSDTFYLTLAQQSCYLAFWITPCTENKEEIYAVINECRNLYDPENMPCIGIFIYTGKILSKNFSAYELSKEDFLAMTYEQFADMPPSYTFN